MDLPARPCQAVLWFSGPPNSPAPPDTRQGIAPHPAVGIGVSCSIQGEFFPPARCVPLQTELLGLFCQKVHLYSQWADLRVQLGPLGFEILRFALPVAGFKNLVAPSDISFFHSNTCTGWVSKSLAICWIVLIPFSASSATRALNSGSCLLRLAFICCCRVRSLSATPNHHNHSLTSGPNFGVHLTCRISGQEAQPASPDRKDKNSRLLMGTIG